MSSPAVKPLLHSPNKLTLSLDLAKRGDNEHFTHPSTLPIFNNYAMDAKTRKNEQQNTKDRKSHKTKHLSKKDYTSWERLPNRTPNGVHVLDLGSSMEKANRLASVSDQYGFFVGGRYNSPRCVNTSYSHRRELQHVTRSLIDKDVVNASMHESATDPFILSKKKELQKYSVRNQFSNAKELSQTKATSQRSQPSKSKMLPTLNEEQQPRPKTGGRVLKNSMRAFSQKQINDTMVQSLKEFDRTQMYGYEHQIYENLLNPDNFPVDMYPTIDYLRRKRNIMRNNYDKMTPERVQKKFTPYRHFVNYRLAVEHVSNLVEPRSSKPLLKSQSSSRSPKSKTSQ